MQPGPPTDPSAPQRPPAAGWPPTPGQRPPEAPVAASASGPDGPGARRSRPGLVSLVALLVEIVVIAGAANQAVARRVSEAVFANAETASFDWGRALLTYQWRFTPLPTDTFHVLYGQFALIGVTLVGTVVLVLAAARGAGFWKVFFATWAAVIASSGVGAIARGFVVDAAGVGEGDKTTVRFALFGTFGPSQFVFVAALLLGFVVALASGITALLTSRPPRPATAVAPPAYAAPRSYPPPPAYASPPEQALPPGSDATREFRRVDDGGATQQFRPATDPEQTQQFPVTGGQAPPPGTPSAPSAPDVPPAPDLPDDPDATRR